MRRRRITSHSAQRASIHPNFALGGGEQAIDQLQGGGFSGTASAQQHQGFTLANFQIQIAE